MSTNGLLDKISRFFNPGYVITISASDADKTVLDKVTDTLKSNGFILVFRRNAKIDKKQSKLWSGLKKYILQYPFYLPSSFFNNNRLYEK